MNPAPGMFQTPKSSIYGRATYDPSIDISIVVPLYNEQDNVVELYGEIAEMMDHEPRNFELIFVDDGSRDDTLPRIREAAAQDERVTIVELMKNFGQTAAMAAGFNHARGKVIVPMDGDRQNDPKDIPALVDKLEDGPGYDIVSGWRKNRQDRLMSRRLPSILANRLIKKLTWTTEIHDFGCSLKAYRREVLEDVHLYGEMHRFLPAICKWRGARITEQVVNHRPRVAGESKYGLKRTIKVLLDLITVKFLGDYLAKPIYFFGKLAMLFFVIAILSLFVAILQRYGVMTGGDFSVKLNDNVMVLFSMMTGLISFLMVMMGVLSELMSRIYHESAGVHPYKVRSVMTGASEEGGPSNAPTGGQSDIPAKAG